MIKRIVATLVAALLLTVSFAVSAEEAADGTIAKPVITSGNTIAIYNIETKTYVFNTSNNKRIEPASTAKMITAMLAYDSIPNLQEPITAPSNVSSATLIGPLGSKGAPRLGIGAGETYTAYELLQAAVITSANDACVCLADYVSGGDLTAFVQKMNDKAKQIGAVNTHFTSCTGLAGEGAYTTAEDVALIASVFYQYSMLFDIARVDRATTSLGTLHTKNYFNSNYLLADYYKYSKKGVIGISAGQNTDTSGYALVSAVTTSNKLTYIVVVMEAASEIRDAQTGVRSFPEENAYADTVVLSEWLPGAFRTQTAVSLKETFYELPVELGIDSDSIIIVPEHEVTILRDLSIGAENNIELKPMFGYSKLTAPVEKDMLVGELKVYYNGTLIDSVPLLTHNTVEKSDLLELAHKFKSALFSDTAMTVYRIFFIIVIAFVAISVCSFVYRCVRKYSKGLKG